MVAYNNRIIGKIALNKMMINKSEFKKYKLSEIEIKINYRKISKEIYQIYELISLIEQMSGEKPLLVLNNSKEVNNKMKLDGGQIKVKLRKKKARMFLSKFLMIDLGERSYYNIKEKNNMNLRLKQVSYRYKDLKFFRKFLVRSFMNIEAKYKIDIKYKEIGFKKEDQKLIDYKFYLEKKNEYKIK